MRAHMKRTGNRQSENGELLSDRGYKSNAIRIAANANCIVVCCIFFAIRVIWVLFIDDFSKMVLRKNMFSIAEKRKMSSLVELVLFYDLLFHIFHSLSSSSVRCVAPYIMITAIKKLHMMGVCFLVCVCVAHMSATLIMMCVALDDV